MTTLHTEDVHNIRELMETVVDSRFSRAEARIDKKFATRDEMNQRFDRLEAKFATKDDLKQFATKDDMYLRFDRLDARFDYLIKKEERNSVRIDMLEQKIIPASN